MADARAVAATVSLMLDLETVRVVQALSSRGVESVLLKGPALARWLYAPSELRSYVDIDLLVSPSDLNPALAVLIEAGYRNDSTSHLERSVHARTLRLWETDEKHGQIQPVGACVDLHTSFHGVDGAADGFWRAISAETETISIQRTDVRIPSERARALVVALHAAANGPRASKPLEDLDRALTRVPDPLWQEAYRLALEQCAEAFFLAGLAMKPAGRDLIVRRGFNARSSRRAMLYSRGMPPVADGIERLTHAPWRDKVLILARELVPTSGFLRMSSLLARRGKVGLGLAYVYRPIWLLLKLPRALWAVLSAHRSAGSRHPVVRR